jgi:hypothetical protein
LPLGAKLKMGLYVPGRLHCTNSGWQRILGWLTLLARILRADGSKTNLWVAIKAKGSHKTVASKPDLESI